MDSSSVSSMSSDDLEVVERDPMGRYVRYDEILGEGAYKIVYKGFDEINGIEIAWNKVELSEEILKSEKQLERLYAEANLLKSLKHENIMRCYDSWIDDKNKTINMITELFTSGNLGQYRKKHNLLDNKAIKNWARQILKGLDYLHRHTPPIVHRDLKCENIFVNGNSGKVKIGDLGLATVLDHPTAWSVIGTPEFMAPELYEEEYNQLVDIYSFGMCMLQMVTREKPYSECMNSAQVYKKVSSGIKPAALSKVTDPQVKQFIVKCLAPVSERLSAIDLLGDPFLALTGPSSPPTCSPCLTESVCSSNSLFRAAAVELQKAIVSEKNVFKLHGKMEDSDSISMTLWIADLGGHTEKANFVFLLQTDTVLSVVEEMKKDLKLSTEDASLIADLMEELVTELVPDSKRSSRVLFLSEDGLSLTNAPAMQHPSVQEHDVRQLLTPNISGLNDPASLSEYAVDFSSNSAYYNSSLSSLSMPTVSDKCQHNQDLRQKGDTNRGNASRGNRKSRKEMAYSHLRKLLFHCGSKF